MKRTSLIGLGLIYLSVLLAILLLLLVFPGAFKHLQPGYLHSAGVFLASVLLLGLIVFLKTSLSNPEKRKILLASPFGFVRLWLGLFEPGTRRAPAAPQKTTPWRQVAVSTVLIAYIYALMEWLFFVTKPSFMDRLPTGEKLAIPLLSGLMAALAALAALLVAGALTRLLGSRLAWLDKYLRHLPGALLAASLGLVLVDNFTYVVLGFGVVDAKSALRLIYVVLFYLFIYVALRKLAKWKPGPWHAWTAVGLLAAGLALGVITLQSESAIRRQELAGGQISRRPNVILFSTDGLSADNMSVYGYKRQTTPFINELAQTSLVGQNNFTNSGHSLGSETSVLTGKLPFETGVLYPPDILVGENKYQHLPGILKQNGYRSIELGVKYYVDANQVNFQSAFDAVNCEENSEQDLLYWMASFGYDNAVYMFQTLASRIRDRLAHVFYIEEMVNSFSLVTENDQAKLDDGQRLACLRGYIAESAESGQPLFAHVHLMGTHGPKFETLNRTYSQGKRQSEKWMTDFYDDSILDFDDQVQSLVAFLKETGQYENTLLVIYTDHGMGWSALRRLPLIVHFPGDDHAGAVTRATQNLDIAPTVLDYLGLEIPQWMDGSSLLGELEPDRLIVSGRTNMAIFADELFMVDEDKRQPPFYQFTELDVIQCQKWYRINLEDLSISQGIVKNFVDRCPAEQLDSEAEIRRQVGELLTGLGYNLPAGW